MESGAGLETFDSLYVTPHRGDLPLACAARLVRERAAGHRILVVTLFARGGHDGEPGTAAAARADALDRLGVAHLSLDLPDAAARGGNEAPLAVLVRERGPQDEEVLHHAADVLTDLAHRSRARYVYAPLAVGGHIDHRLAHEAARAAFVSGAGRNVFLYEERPESFVPGAVRVRLGQLGVRLPPAAAQAPGADGLRSYVLRFHAAPRFRGDLEGGWDRVRSALTALRQWRTGRSWHPLRALGPRLQPVTYATAPEDRLLVQELEGEWSPALADLAQGYARRLGASEHAERYWLLLPPLAADGVETMGGGADEVHATA